MNHRIDRRSHQYSHNLLQARRPFGLIEQLESRWILATDFGDAPLPYPTILAENGARHEAIGPILGIHRDTEIDGIHSLLADADDTTGVPDDEDGVSFGSIRVGQLGATVTVEVSNAPSGARLDAWIDFNRDGSWGGPLEQIARGLSVTNGLNMLTFDVPSTAADGTTFARFRLSTMGNLGTRGVALDGEVEDHAVNIIPPVVGSQVFTTGIISTSASDAYSVFAADVDGDGDTDILSASENDDKIAWYENNGGQVFTARTISTTANGARSVFAADVDGDGDTDILSASENDDKIAWYENNGGQVFTARTISTTADGARSVFAADVDGDGDTDVLSASFTDDKIAWYENNGSQVFAARTISAAANGATSVFAADVDGDGDNDVLSASYSDDKIAWYENNGSQVFTARTISTTANGATSVFAADVDGDGDIDVLSASFLDDKVAWFENNGGQVFNARTISTIADGARSVFAADMDGDGDIDVLSASENDGKIAWYENLPNHPEVDVLGNGVSISDGDATPSAVDHTDFGRMFAVNGTLNRTFTVANTGGASLILAGTPRVIVSGINASDFTVTVQPISPVAPAVGTTTFTVVFDPSGSGLRSAILSIANDDSDEDPYDFVIAGVGLDEPDFGDAPVPYSTTLMENGAGHVASGPMLGIHRDTEIDGVHSLLADADDITGESDDEDGVSFGSIRVGQLGATVTVEVSNAPMGARLDAWIDFNRDGSWGGPLEQIAHGLSMTNGLNSFTFDVPSTAADGTTFARFRLSAMGNLGVRGVAIDGEVEDYAVNVIPPVIGTQVFTDRTISTTANGETSVFAADVDGDGDNDVLSASYSDDKIAWYENNGSQVFTARSISTTANGATSVFAADVDGDGDTDVLSASGIDHKIAWYENSGNQVFTARTISTTATGARSVFAADVDGDGDTDVLSASEFDDKIAWYENNGSQVFAARTISTTADDAQSVFAADVDGDGDTDVLSASSFEDKIAWYENNGSQVFTARTISTTADGARSAFAADVDGDGDTDVLSASFSDDKIAWYENNGSQVFTARTISTTADGARSVFAADVDGDGDTDVLSASFTDDKIAWYENNGSQVFTARTIPTTADGASSVFAADVDGDGDTDVLSASEADDKIAWYENLPNHPEMDVLGNGLSNSDGDATPSAVDHTDFGLMFVVNGTLNRTFTVGNTGGAGLNLVGTPRVVVSGINDSDFTVTVQPVSPVAPAVGTTTFTVAFDPSGSGLRSAILSIANDDSDEDPYDFVIAGVGLDEPDFGDAPVPYPTTLMENGAAHVASGPILGIHRDTEIDGVHSLLANTDDTMGVPNDEDGASFGSIRVGQLGSTVTVEVSNAPSGARLDAWIDFNRDGSWGGPLEQIAHGLSVTNGLNMLTFDVPSAAADGMTFARFRLSTLGNLGVHGVALDGEVEDFAVHIIPPVVGSQVFIPQTISTTANGATSVFAADVDGDGDNDVLSASEIDDKIVWYENNGGQVFTAHTISAVANGATSVFAADVDGDGDSDVLSASVTDDKIAWYENNGSQVFTARIISTDADGARSVFAADMDGDGDTDVLSASGIDHKIAWYENSGNQVFTARTISTTATGARSVFAADVDGDGDTDVLSASEFDDKIAWYENNGSQIFTARTISTTANGAQSVFATDMDGDGDTDVLSASIADDKIAWYENNGSQVFTARTISTTADGARSIFAADVDGDGDTDVLSASANDSKIAWYENNGSQVFTARTISTTDDGASSVFAADMDGDGDIDVLSASENDDTIAWYENRDGDFNNDGSYDCSDINALATAVAMGGYDAQFDLNGDNSLSLADVDQWRVEGGNANLGAGRVYRAGDANLNGAVDGSDYGIWNTHKFTVNSKWCDGNFNADAFVDGSDYAVWNSNKFTSSDSFGVLLNDGRSHTAISPVHALNSYTITVRNGFTLVGEARTSGDLFDSNSRSGMDSRDMLDHAVIWISSMSNCDDSGWSSTYSDIPWRSTKRRILERNDVIDHVFGLRHGIDHMNGAPQSGVD